MEHASTGQGQRFDFECGLVNVQGRDEFVRRRAFFQNSWLLTEHLLKKGSTSLFHHHNNAIQTVKDRNKIFGEQDGDPESSFTNKWAALGIRFDGDAFGPDVSLAALRKAGYDLGGATQVAKEAMFAGIPGPVPPEELDAESFRLSDAANGGALLKGKAVPFRLALPNGVVHNIAGGGDVGVWQGEALYELPFEMPVTEQGKGAAVA
jgi:hypothetical protein